MKIKRQKAFTLIELLVVMAIIAIITTAILANYRSNQAKETLNQALQGLVADLRESQNMAMNGVKLSSGYYGYGIYVNIGSGGSSNSYIIFGETQINNYVYNSGVDAVIKKVNLPMNTKIQAVSSTNSIANIFFESPDPRVHLGISPASSQATITLQNTANTSLTRTVTITDSGLIKNN
jgi:prepilin-type N-terminal cleavage/methylation domain-containing protein